MCWRRLAGQEDWRHLASNRSLETLLRAISVASMGTAEFVGCSTEAKQREQELLLTEHECKKKRERDVEDRNIFFSIREKLNYFLCEWKELQADRQGCELWESLIRETKVGWKGSCDSHWEETRQRLSRGAWQRRDNCICLLPERNVYAPPSS